MTTKTLTDADLASVARHGGRAITAALARAVEDFTSPDRYQTVTDLDPRAAVSYDNPEIVEVPTWIAALSGRLGKDKLSAVWSRMIQPAYGTKDNGWGWKWMAERAAGVGDFAYVPDQSPVVQAVMLHQAEAMVTWPIYREALKPQVYVNVSGGVAETTVTRGDAEVIEQDWDGLNDGGLLDYTREDLLRMRERLSRVAAPGYRAALLRDIDEKIEEYDQTSDDPIDRMYEEAFLPAQPEGTTLSDALGIDEGPAFFQPVEDPS